MTWRVNAVVSGVLLAMPLIGCWTEVRPEPPVVATEPTTLEPPTPAPPGSATALASATPVVDEVAELEAAIPELHISQVAGVTEARVSGWFAKTPRSLTERCKGTKGHTITVYVSARDGDVFASLDRTDADPQLTACVLQQIAFDMDNALTPSLSPSERVQPVESMITLSW
ncbi:MAG: hypothetical protein R3B72_30560 [Polyangiaceae bacterium]